VIVQVAQQLDALAVEALRLVDENQAGAGPSGARSDD